jgi:hypothetical protein
MSNIYENQKREEKRPVAVSAVVRIVIWSVVFFLLVGVFAATMAALSGDEYAAGSVEAMTRKIYADVEDALKLGYAGIQVIGETVAVDYISVVYSVRDVARHLENVAARARYML